MGVSFRAPQVECSSGSLRGERCRTWTSQAESVNCRSWPVAPCHARFSASHMKAVSYILTRHRDAIWNARRMGNNRSKRQIAKIAEFESWPFWTWSHAPSCLHSISSARKRYTWSEFAHEDMKNGSRVTLRVINRSKATRHQVT